MILSLLLALAGPVPIAVPAPAAAAPVMQADRISVTAIGTGPAVILIPELDCPRAVWDGVVPALARSTASSSSRSTGSRATIHAATCVPASSTAWSPKSTR